MAERRGRKFQHLRDFEVYFVPEEEVKVQIIKEGWARWGFFPAVLKRCIQNPARWSTIRCENNFYQHLAIEGAMRRQARVVGVKIRILHGENGVFVKLRNKVQTE